MSEKKVITLYLESWQKRMFKDYAKSVNLKAIASLRNIASLTLLVGAFPVTLNWATPLKRTTPSGGGVVTGVGVGITGGLSVTGAGHPQKTIEHNARAVNPRCAFTVNS